MLLLAEPSPSALAAAVEIALDRVGSIDRQSQHEQVQHTPKFCNLQTQCKCLHALILSTHDWIQDFVVRRVLKTRLLAI